MNNGSKSWISSAAIIFAAVAVLVLLFVASLIAVVVWSYNNTGSNLPPMPQTQPESLEGLEGDVIIDPDEVNSKSGNE